MSKHMKFHGQVFLFKVNGKPVSIAACPDTQFQNFMATQVSIFYVQSS